MIMIVAVIMIINNNNDYNNNDSKIVTIIMRSALFSFVLEAPVPKRSFGDKTSP